MAKKTLTQLPLSRKVIMFFLIQFVAAGCMFSYMWIFRDSGLIICPKTEDNAEVEVRGEKKLLILVWTWPFGQKFPLDQCKASFGISGCILTKNRSLYDQADAVILHHREVHRSKKKLLQLPRPPKQKWVWYTMEAPGANPNMEIMDNLINLTMTYRRDSDIYTPYGWIEALKNPQEFSIPKKTKLVSWVVSNWNPASKRVQYFQELQKHINVDVFGSNHLPLAREQTISTISQYKFYLAFENSQHQDYITEKLWKNSLLSGAVPIVLGTTRENYECFLPPEAFIHVDDFPSAKELAAYLNLLDADKEKYVRYFEWRKQFRIVFQISLELNFCEACRSLKQNPTFRTIPSVAKWLR